MDISATARLWAKACRSSACSSAPVTAHISRWWATRWCCCWSAETRTASRAILHWLVSSRKRCLVMVETRTFDPAEFLTSEDDVVRYLNVWMEDGTPQEIARALGDLARSKGMTEIAKRTGLGRQALYNALSENGNPTLETLMAVLSALGLRLSVTRDAA